MKWWCRECDFDFYNDAPLQARCPRCGTADYRIIPMPEKKCFMSSMAEEIMSSAVGLGLALSGCRGLTFWSIALVFAIGIQLTAIITRSEHYLDTVRLTLAQGKQFSVPTYFLMGFVRNLIITLAMAGIVILIRRLLF